VVFATLLDEIKYSLDEVIDDKQVELNCNFSAVNGMITLKSYLHSIFFNLVSNSIKFCRPGIKAIIEITTALQNDKIQIVFKDNGLGINLAQHGQNLFGLYKRFHDHVDGKGMGLYMVKTQVESLGGKITASSEVNKGTEFRIEFDFS